MNSKLNFDEFNSEFIPCSYPVAGTLEWGPVDLLQKCYCRKSVIKKKLNENKNVERKFAFLVDISIFAA